MARSTGSQKKRRRRKRITCDDCFFQQNMLCALDKTEPCPTFRTGGSDGLKPPRQLSFMFPEREQPRTLVTFEPPSAYVETEAGDHETGDPGEAQAVVSA